MQPSGGVPRAGHKPGRMQSEAKMQEDGMSNRTRKPRKATCHGKPREWVIFGYSMNRSGGRCGHARTACSFCASTRVDIVRNPLVRP